MWSYKILKPEGGAGIDGWYAVTNVKPMSRINVKTSSREQIEKHLAEIRDVALVPHRKLQDLLTSSSPVGFAVEVPPELPTQLPPDATPAPWTSNDIGQAAGATLAGNARMTLVARGTDIFGKSDNFHFTSQPVTGDFAIETTVLELLESGRYAKAGVMLRRGTSPDAAFAFMHVFTDGTLAFCWRAAAGEAAQERKFHFGDLPLRIRLERKGEVVRGLYLADGQWELAGELSLSLTPGDQVGFAVSSNSDRNFTRAVFANTSLSKEEGR
jgi:regulation of enolase protein 1 (concanavalin A-like superfamily)